MNNTFKSYKILLYVVLTGVVALVALGLYSILNKTPDAPIEQPIVNIQDRMPVFIWNYSSFEVNQIPRTRITLEARYPNGSTTTKLIDEIEGGCNEYDERDADVYQASQMIICYYAGLGRYYKIVENGSVYEVKRKVFEEASPEYNPPQSPFVTISTF